MYCIGPSSVSLGQLQFCWALKVKVTIEVPRDIKKIKVRKTWRLLKSSQNKREPFLCPRHESPPGAYSNRIVRLFVYLAIPFTYKMPNLKFGRWYSYQTWIVSSSKGCSHPTDITMPLGLHGVKISDLL